jgi:hypothetical protein
VIIWRDAGVDPIWFLPQMEALEAFEVVGRAILKGPTWHVYRGDTFLGEAPALDPEASALLSAA